MVGDITAADDTKYCPGCKATKSVDAFSRNRSRPDGRAIHCKVCQKGFDTKWRAGLSVAQKRAVRDKAASWQRRHREQENAKARQRYVRHPLPVVNAARDAEIVRLHGSGLSAEMIAERVGLSRARIYQILRPRIA